MNKAEHEKYIENEEKAYQETLPFSDKKDKDKVIMKDEIKVKMITALGLVLIDGIMPKSMEDGLIKTYLNSGTVKSTYLYINDKEVTDGINHNPFKMR